MAKLFIVIIYVMFILGKSYHSPTLRTNKQNEHSVKSDYKYQDTIMDPVFPIDCSIQTPDSICYCKAITFPKSTGKVILSVLITSGEVKEIKLLFLQIKKEDGSIYSYSMEEINYNDIQIKNIIENTRKMIDKSKIECTSNESVRLKVSLKIRLI